VANRNQPMNDSNGTATIYEDGNLVVLNGQKQVIWSSNVSNIASNTTSQFSEFGNLVLLESTTGNIYGKVFSNLLIHYCLVRNFLSTKEQVKKLD
jgi:hypothetical protein